MIKLGDIVLPGDIVKDLKAHNGEIKLGPGLRRDTDQERIIVTKPGELCHKSPNIYWIEGQQKRYVPKRGELVLGVVAIKRGDLFKVDIGSSELASLSVFSFEGATKKQKPDIQIGDVIYGRLLSAHREMEPELVCIDSYGKAKQLGILSNEGFMFNISQEFAHRLLNFENPLLRKLGKKTTFEIAIGMNGRIWINARSTHDIDTVYSALLAAEKQSENDILKLCRK